MAPAKPPDLEPQTLHVPRNRGTWSDVLTRLILGPDTERHINLKITLSGQVGYVGVMVLIWHSMQVGWLDLFAGLSLAALVAGSALMVYLSLRLGWSQRLRDPAMTLPQMMLATVLTALGCIAAPALHIALLMQVATTLAYSTFALKGRAVLIVQSFTMLVYIASSIVMCQLRPDYYKPEVEILVLGILAGTVVMLTWSGSQIAIMRARQRSQREELSEMLVRIEELATHDTLTGLYNRRHMNTLLAHHVERTHRHAIGLTVAMIDLDHFKQVNDTHGHGVGDQVLQTFARTAQAALSGADTLARWGGEEFLLLTSASPQQVLALLDRVRAQLADKPAANLVPALRVSYSAGVAPYRPGESIVTTISRADDALYEAKAAGRAQSRLAPVADAGVGAGDRAAPALACVTSMDPALAADAATIATPPPVRAGATRADAAKADASADLAPAGPRSWVLGRDLKQRRSVARTLVGSSPYLFSLLALAYATHVRQVEASTAWPLAWGLVLTPLLMFALVRSGQTRHLADPAITLVQMLVALTWGTALYATMGQAHAAQLMNLVMALTVAVCNMRWRQAWIACGYAVVLLTAAMLVMPHLRPDVYDPRVEFGCWVLMMFNAPAVMLMGMNLGKLRSRLSSQRQQLKEAVARLSELATRDELTGLHNRNHMNEMLAHYRRRHETCGETFTIALIDMDHFKHINDRYGHAVGDEALQAFARQAAGTLRQTDVIARWGGEEFLVLCPQNSPEQAAIGLERLRKAFSEIAVSHSVPELRASFSVGLSAPDGAESIERMLARADAALYEAKRSGRNRICLEGAVAAGA